MSVATGRPSSRRNHAARPPIRLDTLFTVAVAAGLVLSVAAAFVGAPLPLAVVPTVAHAAGMVAGYAAAITLILVARIPALDRSIGTDRLTRWHAVAGATTLVATLAHGVFATVGFAQATAEGLDAVGDVLALPGLVAATIGTGLILLAGTFSMRRLRRRLSYETWHLLHLVMYVGIALAFTHMLAGPDLAGRPVEQVAWALLYAFAFTALVRHRLIEPLVTMARQGLRIESVRQEGPGVTTIVVRGRDVDELRAEPGQFFRWRFLSGGTWLTAHPFSLSAPPTHDRLRLTIKDAGEGTRRISRLRPGTRVLAEGPYGALTGRRRRGDGVLLVAGGVGITPMRTLFETLPLRGEPLTLVYRASRDEDLVLRDELDRLAARRGATVHYVVGRSSDPATELGPARLAELVPGVERHDVYICASPRFSDAMRESLRGAGVPRARIHEERFAF